MVNTAAVYVVTREGPRRPAHTSGATLDLSAWTMQIREQEHYLNAAGGQHTPSDASGLDSIETSDFTSSEWEGPRWDSALADLLFAVHKPKKVSCSATGGESCLQRWSTREAAAPGILLLLSGKHSAAQSSVCGRHADRDACATGIPRLVGGRPRAWVWLRPWLCTVQGSRALACLGPAAAQVCPTAALTGALTYSGPLEACLISQPPAWLGSVPASKAASRLSMVLCMASRMHASPFIVLSAAAQVCCAAAYTDM